MRSLSTSAIIFFASFLLIGSPASAQLKPEEVAIIAMADSEESQHIAEYYAKARGIPPTHIILLEGKPELRVARSKWERKIRPAILIELEKRKLTDKVRCLVTCWDVPLVIGRLSGSYPGLAERKYALEKERAALVDRFDNLIYAMDSFGSKEPPRKRSPLLSDTKLEQLQKAFNTAIIDLQQRIKESGSEDDKKRVRTILQQMFIAANGSDGMVRMMSPRSESTELSPEKKTQRALVIVRIQTLQQAITEMELLPGSESRDRLILDFVQTKSGLFGAVRWIDQQMYLITKNESHSSFDSELSMILYPPYTSFSWAPNPMHYAYRSASRRRVMMVSRLAAPSVKIVERMIDDAVAVEKVGLKGNVYIDAKGVKPKSGKTSPGSPFEYDQSLRDLAKRLRDHTTLTVVSDDREALFQPGYCPNAALYCGWYSLKKYIDAFDWNRGAVAYHLASYEAKWLREPPADADPDEKPWCPYLLEDGVCATLGPTLEPYLSAFPLPDDFFSLLLTGKLPIVEVYYRTKRFNSWTLVLVGDPLYTPYKANPMLDVKDLPQRLGGGRSQNDTAEQEQTEQ